MSIIITRIDERLIHGQVAYSWSVAYQVNEIVVVDDEIVTDDMQQTLLEIAVPDGKKFKLLSIKEGAEYLKKENGNRSFLVVKSPKVILGLIEAGVEFDSINIGGMYFKDGKEEITRTVYVDEEEKEVFRKIADNNIQLDVRTAPRDKSINLITKI